MPLNRQTKVHVKQICTDLSIIMGTASSFILITFLKWTPNQFQCIARWLEKFARICASLICANNIVENFNRLKERNLNLVCCYTHAICSFRRCGDVSDSATLSYLHLKMLNVYKRTTYLHINQSDKTFPRNRLPNHAKFSQKLLVAKVIFQY